MQNEIHENNVHGYWRQRYKFLIRNLMFDRMNLLKNLRETDYRQFEFLLEKLDLQYKPKPRREDVIMIARKEGLRQLTNEYCENVKAIKLNEYRDILHAEKLPFLEQKIKNLEFIREEQKALNMAVTIAQEQIDDARQNYEILKKERDAIKVEPSKKKWKVY